MGFQHCLRLQQQLARVLGLFTLRLLLFQKVIMAAACNVLKAASNLAARAVVVAQVKWARLVKVTARKGVSAAVLAGTVLHRLFLALL
jgi:hypothetical protein